MSSLPLNYMILFSLLTALTQITPLGQGAVSKNVRCPRMQKGKRCSLEQKSLSQQTITFGLMLSFVDQKGSPLQSSFDDGHDLAPAVYLAVKQVNNRSDLLKDYDIQISRFDGGCEVSSRTVLGINELCCSSEPIVGIIGPSCDDSSRVVSQFTNRKEFSTITINYDSQTKLFTNLVS